MMDPPTPSHRSRQWRPLIMSFQQFYDLTPERLRRSELGQIPESAYKPPGRRPAA